MKGRFSMNALLVCPEFPNTFWSFKHALAFVGKKSSLPPLGLLTIAPMLPPDWGKRLVDLNVRKLNEADLKWADCVFISAMTVQREATQRLIARCKAAGLRIVAGGPLFQSEREQFEGVDHFVLNEAELTLPAFLVVEDDKALRDGLSMNLRMEGYEVLMAADGEEGMRMAFGVRPDLIVLDIMMPCWSGLEILQELRKRGDPVPVLVLSARHTTADKVEGLHLGADDYMTKPFDLPELIARVKVMLRRRRAEGQSLPVLSFGKVVIDRAARRVQVGGKPVDLSAKEFDLLSLLAASPGQVFTRETILERVWGWDYDGTARTVDNFVASLRKKLEAGRGLRKCIRTVPLVGYKFDPL